MSGSNTEREAALLRRLRRAPLGPYDAELAAFLRPLRNRPAAGKHALLRLPGGAEGPAWTLVRLGGRDAPVQIVGGRWTSRADAEWAVLRARWMALHGWDPEEA